MATKDKGGTGYLDIIKQIKGKNFSPVYFLQGDEPYFIDLITKEIESTVLSEAEKSFNQTLLYGRDVNMSAVLSQARRFPMMSPYQVVIVKEAQNLADLGREEGVQSFLSYLSNPVPTTILVFCFLGKKLDGRQALSKQIAKSGILFTSNTIYENQVPEWVNSYVASKKIRISNKANAMLSEYLGNNLERISNELDKIMLNLGGATEINETHVEKYVGVNKDYNFFELQKALLFRNNEKVFRILNYFEANEKSNPPIFLIAMFYSLFSKMFLLYSINNVNEKSIGEVLGGGNYFQIKELLQGRQKYSFSQVCRGIELLAQADTRLKGVDSGSMSHSQIIREFVVCFLQ